MDNAICCEILRSAIDNSQSGIYYDTYYGSYCVATRDSGCIALRFCPFCGRKLPELEQLEHDPIDENEMLEAEQVISGIKTLSDAYTALGRSAGRISQVDPHFLQVVFRERFKSLEIVVKQLRDGQLQFLVSPKTEP